MGAEAPSLTPQATRTSAPSPNLTPLPPQRRGIGAVLVTLAGARADLVDRYLADGTLPALGRLAGQGIRADFLQPPEPAAGVPAQFSMLTGVSPARTGIIADQFERPSDPLGQPVRGFDVAPGVEPIWRSAMRSGARTALIGYPPGMLDLPAERADWMVTPGAAVAPSAQHVLKFSDAKDWGNAPSSFSSMKEAHTVIVPGGAAPGLDLWVLAVDSTDDHLENYDTWFLSRSKKLDASAARLRLNEWVVLTIDPLLQTSAAFKVTDAASAHFAIYQTPVMVNQLAPLEFAREITRQFGGPPAAADGDALARNWIDQGTFVQMDERQTSWLTDVALYVYRHFQPDLLLLRLTIVENAQRALLLTLPRQPAYAERGAAYALALQHAYAVADGALAQLYAQIDFDAGALLVVSPNGQAPVHTVVNINRLLIDRKWLVLRNGAIDASKTKAFAEAAGGMAHIYVNLKGRETTGVVEQADFDKLQGDIAAALKDLADPVDAQPIFGKVLRRPDLDSLGVQHDNSGDIVVQARAGFMLADGRERATVLEPAVTTGADGYGAAVPDMRGIFVAAGAGLRSGARLTNVRAIDVAPTLAALLRITQPVFPEGRVLEEALR
jgi:predicted AlkP superfamily phosphohydrolase/phosphomutase